MDYARVLSVNVGEPRPIEASVGVTGIDKRPADGPVPVTVPGPSRSGLAGDAICDVTNHGGPDQAVYAYAREDLDTWAAELGRELPAGVFGENLTTSGVDTTGALIGERWRVGTTLLEVSCPRIPCRTFAVWLEQERWQHTFTQRALPGAYLRVLTPGAITAGDSIDIVHRPDHDVTIGVVFRALTLEPELLPRLVDIDALSGKFRDRARKRVNA
ncbi:MOSC domain-containing protein [Actinokineospora fastidiosa]|uniref:Molybdenum cofactor biosysynthesis protein n=1 Tax=Actinokineospora fastidiosa TaxID=1816 RepID=A0A918GFR7_9PSEU|nr:MOSC domain-containing protein [Actinokineospora fastidiosa]GGS33487.1 molybdenum cofactor biosysynthesis protein [Actinokineospora fastidiosa]